MSARVFNNYIYSLTSLFSFDSDFLTCIYSLYYTGDVALPYLMTALKHVYDWFNLGMYLGVPHATLMEIKIEQRERVVDCKREMLVAWLRSSEVTTKSHLMKALWNITHIQTVSDTRTLA